MAGVRRMPAAGLPYVSRVNHRFSKSPIDTLIDIKAEWGLRCSHPNQLPACWGYVGFNARFGGVRSQMTTTGISLELISGSFP